MPTTPTEDFIVEDVQEEDEHSFDDFGFIITADGELKSMMVPAHLMEDPPKEVIEILKIFGIDDINLIGDRTIH